MDTSILQRIRESLQRQRQNLQEWLHQTPAAKRQIRLGPLNEEAFQEHLHVLDTALGRADNRTLGLCEVCHEYIEAERLELDFTACVCIDHYSEEQKRRLEWELEFSHKVQKTLLPQQLPRIAGLQIAAFSQPAEIVGGDYFDFFHFLGGAHGVAIADVMGKGLPASLLMASLQASLRILVPEHASPVEVMQRLNSLFSHNTQLIKFITLFLARYEPASRVLEYCNAGHNPPLLVRAGDGGHAQAEWLRPTGAAIGLAESFNFSAGRVALADGDTLLLYTDGVTEATNPAEEEFGEPRLVALVQQHLTISPQDLIRQLRLALHAFTGARTPADDVTLVAVRVAPSQPA